MCGAKITAQVSCVRKLLKVFQLYSCLKCTQSTLTEREHLDREKRDNAHKPPFNTIMFLIEMSKGTIVKKIYKY